jgi:signal transduction histidine kinase
LRRAVWPIREQIPEGLPTVFADPNRLQQVLDNLLENAVCYVEAPGTVQVRVEAQQDGVLLSVEDTGPGIPAAALPHLFDRFYRVEQFRSRESGGSGLLDDAIGSVYGVGYHFQLPESPQPRP